MLKNLYKIIILLIIFVISLYYFSGDISVENRQKKLETVDMGEITYPTISILLDDIEVNSLHGYSTNLDSRMSRDSITPIDREQSFHILIQENDYEIRRLDYELLSIYDDSIIESDNIKALEQDGEGEYKLAKIKFKTDLKEGQEYYARFTLVTNKSKKINYYTRIKQINESHYKEKLQYIEDFNTATFNKDDDIIKYLETRSNSPDSLAYVNINSTFNLISWDEAKPNVIGQIVPTIKEISEDFASVELSYVVSINTQEGNEKFYVKEFYRIRYSPTRMYLLDYERNMESVFPSKKGNIGQGDIKLGVTSNPDIEIFSNTDSTKFAFVFNRELWHFNQINTSVVKVFSFRQDESDFTRDTIPQHDVEIINIDEDGNVDFLVYGYMNRGAYEGYVGIVLYRFHSMDNRIEELTYIPINMPYQFLREMIGDFSYINELEMFYFHLNKTIYGYNLRTKQLEEITNKVSHDEFVFSRENHYIAWEERDDQNLSKAIIIYDLESREKTEILADKNTVIKLLGTIGNDFVYGIANNDDIITSVEGKVEIPMFSLVISDSKGNLLKRYKDEGYYITDIGIEGNIIRVERGNINSDNENKHITPAKDDYILNNMELESETIGLVEKDSEYPLKELYISSPLFSKVEEAYKYKETENIIVTKDTTLRIDKDIEFPGKYVVYAIGDIKGIYENAGEAIKKADDLVGVVLDTNQHLIWKREFTKSNNQIEGIKAEESPFPESFKACAATLVNYKYNNATITNPTSGYELMQGYFSDSYVNLTGATLDQALYFVSENRPVIAKTKANYYEVIVGYNNTSLVVFDPIKGRQYQMSRTQASEQFERFGNVFISYGEEY